MSTATDTMTTIGKAEVGYHEGRSGGHWNNDQKYSDQLPGAAWSDGQPWCDTFVHWLAWKAGFLNLWPDVTTKAKAGSASCDVTGAAWKKAGRWSEYPAVGAQVFFGSPSDLSHTGYVYAYDATYAYTIEGNTNSTGAREGDGVYLKKHVRTDPHLIGYGYPDYPGGIVSADPAWSRVATDPVVPPRPPATTKAQLGVDYADARPTLTSLHGAGFRFAMRYIGGGRTSKQLTASERDQLRAAGFGIGLIFETSARRAAAGRAAGVADCKAAEKAAAALGYPKSCPIFYAVDFDATAAQVEPYFAGIRDTASYEVGAYGGFKIVEARVAPWLWQTGAWSGGQKSAYAHLFQRITPTVKASTGGGGWDENVVLRDFPLWTPVTKTPTKTKGRRLRIGTWNLERDRKPATVLRELIALLARTHLDVLCLQECNDYREILTQIPGYTAIAFYKIREQAESMILVRTGLHVEDAKALQVTFDPDGAGPQIAGWYTTKKGGHTPAKHVTFARVNGFPIVSGHPAPSVQTAALRATHPRQWRSYQDFMHHLAPILGDYTHMLVACDWNVDASVDHGTQPLFPKRVLNDAGMTRAFAAKGTHAGGRRIDGFGVKGGVVSDLEVIDLTTGSDHKPVVGLLTY